MRNFNPTRKVVRKSNNYYTSATIQPQMVQEKSEFSARSWFLYGDSKTQQKVTVLEMANKYGCGMEVSILKVGEKRNQELSFSLGLDEVEILIEYLQKIKSELQNYNGDVIEKI